MLQEERSCSHGQRASLCYQATPPYCVNSVRLSEHARLRGRVRESARVCVQLRARDRKRETERERERENVKD